MTDFEDLKRQHVQTIREYESKYLISSCFIGSHILEYDSTIRYLFDVPTDRGHCLIIDYHKFSGLFTPSGKDHPHGVRDIGIALDIVLERMKDTHKGFVIMHKYYCRKPDCDTCKEYNVKFSWFSDDREMLLATLL